MRHSAPIYSASCCVLTLKNITKPISRNRSHDTVSQIYIYESISQKTNKTNPSDEVLNILGFVNDVDFVDIQTTNDFIYLSCDSTTNLPIWSINVYYNSKHYTYSTSNGTLLEHNNNTPISHPFNLTDIPTKQVFDHLKGLHQPMIHIIKGFQDNFVELYDTVSYLYKFYLDFNKSVSVVMDSEICIINNDLYLGGILVKPGDTVWVKIDPDQSERYFSILRLLVPFEHQNIRFVNPPSFILSYDDKTIPLVLGNRDKHIVLSNKSCIANIPDNLLTSPVAIKRLNGCRGGDVSLHNDGGALADFLVNDYPHIVQKSIAVPGTNRDSRLFWFNGEYIGVLDIFGTGNNLCKMVGTGGGFSVGSIDAIFSNKTLAAELEILSKFLSDKKCVMAGIDVLNNTLITEVNISNPSVFKNYIDLSKNNFLFNLPV